MSAPNVWGPPTISGSALLAVDDVWYGLPKKSRVKFHRRGAYVVAYFLYDSHCYVFSKFGQLIETPEKSLARGRRWRAIA